MKAIIHAISKSDLVGFFTVTASIEEDKGILWRGTLEVKTRQEAVDRLQAQVDSIQQAQMEADLFSVGEVIDLQ